MRWQLHHLVIEGSSNSEQVLDWWATSFAACPPATQTPDVQMVLDVVPTLPPPPATASFYEEGEFLAYHRDGKQTLAYLPHYGRLDIDLDASASRARIRDSSLHAGALEDLVAVGLSPHLRRRGLYLVHAFAAALNGRAVLLVGDTGAGKTTTGLALLDRGWKLLSNDSPLLDDAGCALRYPGLISAYPRSFSNFAASAPVAEGIPGDQKVMVAAESIWPGVWTEQATVEAVLFPQIETDRDHELQRLTPAETIQRLLPHTMERWDKETIGAHLAALRRLAETARGYLLYLGPDVSAIGGYLEERLIGDW